MFLAPKRPLLALLTLFASACDTPAAGSYPPEDPQLRAENDESGDPYGGRFPMAEAIEGLDGDGKLLARFSTEVGEIRCELRPDLAPLTVANFIGLARGLRPFREDADGPWLRTPYYDGVAFHRVEPGQFVQAGKRGADKWPGFRIQDEIGVGTAMDRPGLLAMANDSRPDSGAAQFFITMAPLRDLDGKYTLFGRCEDEWVVREIASRLESGRRVLIRGVEITRSE